MKKPLLSADTTTLMRLCVENPSIVDKVNTQLMHPFVIPSLVRNEAIGNLAKDYRDEQKAKKKVNETIKKLKIIVRETTKRDKEHGIKKYHGIKELISGKRVGKNDCIILCCMKRLKISHIFTAGDELFVKEAKKMGFEVIQVN